MHDAAALVQRFRRDADTRFGPEELAVLDAAASSDLWAAKIAGLHHFKAGNLPRAVTLMQLVLAREPTAENIVNLAVLHRDAGDFDAAIALLAEHRATLEPVRYHDMMCSCLGHLGRLARAAAHGTEALRLKDAAGPPQPRRDFTVTPIDLEQPSRNVIAFSLWGSDTRYLQGALNNAVVARYLYPGWTARFYVDESVPLEVRRLLTQNGAEVMMVRGMPAAEFGLYWRFLVEDDERVAIYLVRDADSVLNVKERAAVGEWLRSGRAFHVMRDNIQHCELVLAGMWGAHRGNIGEMTERVLRHVAGIGNRANFVHRDQHFLRSEIWPILRQDVLVHDAHFNFGAVSRFDPAFALPRRMHIGQNDWVHYRRSGNAPTP